MNIVYSLIKNNPEKLLKFYYSRKYKEDRDVVIDRLIELNAIDELFEIKDDRPSVIYPYLIEIYKDDEENLFELYQDAKNEYKNNIIDYLKKIEAIGSLRSIKNDYPNEIYPYLISKFKNDEVKLVEISLDNPIAFFSAKESSYSLDEFLSENHHFLNFIAESPLLLREVFIKSNDKMKLYLLLIYYTRSNLKFFPIAHYYNIGSDCYKENIKEYSSNFEGYMNKALEGFEKNDYILAYLIDREAFKNKLDYIKKTKIIVLDYDEKIKDIKNKYLQLKKKANSKQEIESLLKQESTEFDLIFVQKKVNILMSIMNSNKKLHSSKVLPKPLVSRVESKNKVNLETITIDHKLTNNYQSDRKKIDSELESIIINLNDANKIMKAKAQAKKEQNLLIDTKDFCFTLQTSNYQLANNDKIIKVLGEFLIRYEDMTIRKAILHFASRSTNKSWIKYLEQIMNIDKSGQFNEFYIYFLSRNKSSKNLKLLFMMLELKYKFPKIDNGVFIELRLITSNSKYLLCKKENNLFLLSMYDFEVISSYDTRDYSIEAHFSPDGLYALVTPYHSVELLSIPDLKVISSYRTDQNLSTVHFSPDSKYILAQSGYEIKLLSIPDLKVISSYDTRDYSIEAHFSPDGLYALVTLSSSVEVLSIPNMAILGSYVTSTADFSPDGQYILAKHYEEIKLLSIPDLKVISSNHLDYSFYIADFSPDGNYILAQRGYEIELLSIPNMAILGSYRTNQNSLTADFSPDGLYALVITSSSVKLLSIPNMAILGSYKTNKNIRTVHFSPDGQYILAQSVYEIELLSIPNMAILGSYRTNQNSLTADFSPDGQYILAKHYNEIKLLSIPNMAVLGSYKTNKKILTVHFSLEGLSIFGECENGLYNIYVPFYPIMLEILEHLLYLYYFANKDDIVNLIELKSNVGKTFQPSQRDALINIIDKIIEKAGKESKTISLNQEQRADSKDIFVNKD
jgi:WD40 repeat protein